MRRLEHGAQLALHRRLEAFELIRVAAARGHRHVGSLQLIQQDLRRSCPTRASIGGQADPCGHQHAEYRPNPDDTVFSAAQ